METETGSPRPPDQATPFASESRGLQLKRKDFLGVDEQANANNNRTYYFKRDEEVTSIIDTCSRKLQSEPGNLRALYLRGSSYLKKGLLDLAVQDLSIVIKKEADHIDSLFTRGMTYLKMGKPELAIADLTLVLDLNPDHVNAAFARAACYNQMGHLAQAIEDYNLALFKDQTLNSPIRDDTLSSLNGSTTGGVRHRTYSQSSQLTEGTQLPFSPKPEADRMNRLRTATLSPAPSVASDAAQGGGRALSSNLSQQSQATGRKIGLDVDAAGIFSLYGVASPTLTPGRSTSRSRGSFSYGHGTAGNSGVASAVSTPAPPQTPQLPDDSAASVTSQSNSIQQPQQKSPQNTAEFHHNRGYELRRQGDFAGAIQAYSTALQHDPQHFKALFNRGFAFDKTGQFQQAIRDYSAAIQLQPKYSFAFYNRGISYDHVGDSARALEDFSTAISMQLASNGKDQSPQQLQSLLDCYHNRALMARKLHRYGAAIEDYSTILQHAPNQLKALINRALCYEKNDQLAEAMRDVNQSISLLQQQQQHLARGNAAAGAQQAYNSNMASCLLHRALLYERLNHAEAAVADYTTALMHGAPAFSTLVSRAKLYFHQQQDDKGLDDVQAALQLQPQDVAALFLRAHAFKNSQSLVEATKDFDRLVYLLENSLNGTPVSQADPTTIAHLVLAFTQRGYCHRKRNMLVDAVADYTSALKLQPQHIKALNNRGFLFAKLQRYEDAIADYSKAIQLDPRNTYAFHNRGIAYDKLGSLDLAMADFGKVFELDSQQSLASNVAVQLFPAGGVGMASGNSSVSSAHPTAPLSAAAQSAANKLTLRQQAQLRSKQAPALSQPQQAPSPSFGIGAAVPQKLSPTLSVSSSGKVSPPTPTMFSAPSVRETSTSSGYSAPDAVSSQLDDRLDSVTAMLSAFGTGAPSASAAPTAARSLSSGRPLARPVLFADNNSSSGNGSAVSSAPAVSIAGLRFRTNSSSADPPAPPPQTAARPSLFREPTMPAAPMASSAVEADASASGGVLNAAAFLNRLRATSASAGAPNASSESASAGVRPTIGVGGRSITPGRFSQPGAFSAAH